MDDPNVTYITFDAYVEMQKYRYLYFVIMLSAFVTILYSNGTVVYVIYAHENLHQPMYVFIAALLVNSLLYSTAVYPKLLVDSLSDRQVITYPACLFQWFMFYSFGGSEFLLLAVMAYDRYVAICKPLQYSAILRRRTVGIFLAVSWFLPFCCNAAAVALSARQKLCRFSINGILCSSTVHSLHCQDSNHALRVAMSAYGLVLLFHLVVLSLVLILFSYIRILLVSYQSSKEVIMYHPLFNPFVYGLKMKEISKHLSAHFHLEPQLNASV
ncbi:olfactory receptor 11-like isoform X2 [Takifugu flavidus]|uniref:Olfactory receptor 4X1 n=1 Tax=Takifugu flavidus TaxID=433684 RepID=A0A5C6PMR0_9TELE|nr:olfactory receptor 11-like isoform X2 [Takifugu flavidus]TWW80229.1 Olfactory receptor 4X1 [Takifugu flavidus]